MSFLGKNSTNQSQDDMVAVKSDLLLLARDSSRSGQGSSKPRLQLRLSQKRPSFHIDPEAIQSTETGCCSKSGIKRFFVVFFKLATLLCLLYLFVTSLNLLATSFRLIGGKTASVVFRQSELLSNPIVGLMIGVLVTVIVQSSSTSSSIIVSMVAANFLDVQTAIPIIMGANIGTSVTNTLVSFGQINDREQFERAFAGATVHDMFNWLCVLVFLPLEVATGYLYRLSELVLSGFDFEQQDVKVELLSKITKPLTNKIVKIDKKVLTGWSLNDANFENATLHKRYCSNVNESEPILCNHLTAQINLGDLGIGLILLCVSLLCLCFCLICIVRILSSLLKGSVAQIVEHFLNADLPYVPWLTGYLAILIGAVMTFLLQSSSIFTSSLTPLVGLGMITVKRIYPLTLGSNLGTTTTALLAAFAAEGSHLKPAIQIALVHLFFNLSGLLLYYPIPFTRFPIGMALRLGKTTAQYRWFAIIYLLGCFLFLPVFVFSISLAGPIVMACVFVPITLILVCVIVLNLCQSRCPNCLPSKLRTWDWLPKPLRSLEPYDNIFSKIFCCCKRKQTDHSYSPIQVTENPFKSTKEGLQSPDRVLPSKELQPLPAMKYAIENECMSL